MGPSEGTGPRPAGDASGHPGLSERSSSSRPALSVRRYRLRDGDGRYLAWQGSRDGSLHAPVRYLFGTSSTAQACRQVVADPNGSAPSQVVVEPARQLVLPAWHQRRIVEPLLLELHLYEAIENRAAIGGARRVAMTAGEQCQAGHRHRRTEGHRRRLGAEPRAPGVAGSGRLELPLAGRGGRPAGRSGDGGAPRVRRRRRSRRSRRCSRGPGLRLRAGGARVRVLHAVRRRA